MYFADTRQVIPVNYTIYLSFGYSFYLNHDYALKNNDNKKNTIYQKNYWAYSTKYTYTDDNMKYFFFTFKRNKISHFTWIIFLADCSHEMLSYFLWKIQNNQNVICYSYDSCFKH